MQLTQSGHSYFAMNFQEFSKTFQDNFQVFFGEAHHSSTLIMCFMNRQSRAVAEAAQLPSSRVDKQVYWKEMGVWGLPPK